MFQAVQARAASRVLWRGVRSDDPSSKLRGLEKTFTARAITRPTTQSETIDCSAMVSFAHDVMGMTSVGLKAVLVSPRIR